jgi:hypothetical protein
VAPPHRRPAPTLFSPAVAAAPRRRPISSPLRPEVLRRLLHRRGGSAGGLRRRPRRGGRVGDLRRRSLPSRGGGLRRRTWPRRPMPCAPAPSSMRCSAGPGSSPSGRFQRRAGPARKISHRAVPGPPARHDARHGPARKSHRAA